MKRISFLIFFVCATLFAFAQPRQGGNPPNHGPNHGHPKSSLTLQSKYKESFDVYLDGSLYSKKPSKHVVMEFTDNASHDIMVVMKAPAQKIVYFEYCAKHNAETYTVSYNPHDRVAVVSQEGRGNMGRKEYRSDMLLCKRPDQPQCGQAGGQHQHQSSCGGTNNSHCSGGQAGHCSGGQSGHCSEGHGQPGHVQAPHHVQDQAPHHGPAVVSDKELADIESLLRKEAFDKDKMAIANTVVASKLFTTDQIIRLASTFTFDNSKTDFLVFAYNYCVDKENYYRVVNILTHSSDKEKVLKVMRK